MSTFSQDNVGGKKKADESKSSEAQKKVAEGDAQAKEAQQEETNRQGEAAKKVEDAREDKPASEQAPANVQQEKAGNDASNLDNTADTDDAKAGDLAAAEGNEHVLGSGTEKTGMASSAASRTQEGPTQDDYFTQDDLKTADSTEGPVKILTTDGQDVSAVQERLDEEIGDLAAAPMEEAKMVTGDGVVAYDKPGTLNAAFNGVQQDASGHFESVAHTRSSQSGTRA